MSGFMEELENLIARFVDTIPRNEMAEALRDAADAVEDDTDEDEDGA